MYNAPALWHAIFSADSEIVGRLNGLLYCTRNMSCHPIPTQLGGYGSWPSHFRLYISHPRRCFGGELGLRKQHVEGEDKRLSGHGLVSETFRYLEPWSDRLRFIWTWQPKGCAFIQLHPLAFSILSTCSGRCSMRLVYISVEQGTTTVRAKSSASWGKPLQVGTNLRCFHIYCRPRSKSQCNDRSKNRRKRNSQGGDLPRNSRQAMSGFLLGEKLNSDEQIF